MSVLKYANGQNRGLDAIRKGVTYVLNPDKTKPNLTEFNGVSRDTPCEDMETVQTLLSKNTGRRYIHIVISFDRNVSVAIAYNVACYAAEYYADNYQYVLAIHTNTANVHAHIILSTVNVRTGKKFSQSRKEMLTFREHVNFCLRQFGLDEIGKNTTSKNLVNTQDFIDNFWGDDDEDNYDEALDCDTDEFEHNKSFFGPCDSEISEAEEADKLRKAAYAYFEGKSDNFPVEMPSYVVDNLYSEWLEEEIREREEKEEEEESYKNFFNKFPGRPAH